MSKLTGLINHNPKPFCDLDGNLAEKPGLSGCIGFAIVAGAVCGYALFKWFVWMRG